MNILFICGSISTDSLNRKLAKAAMGLLPAGASGELVEVGDLPLFSTDAEKDFPAEATNAKERIARADAVLFVTPEYNRSIPGALKNFLDWTSRPAGQHPWGGKSVGVIGATPGSLGTATAQYDLKRILTYFGARVMGQPEFFLGGALQKMTPDGAISDDKTRELLTAYLAALMQFATSSTAQTA